ncbi:MAG: tRNA (adenosine(37)-N6)-threonylcarbamoyltransferase complex transferase subunit TsaD [Bacteroidetes bacterium]|jgi:N6-L-threonylcarbamoyladenine synthase|nr:tRNA (adenosine(37)-N6)-threonylcarbamoyltransferase complex transferase subunit TsaD [Bacteroidota bacterium]
MTHPVLLGIESSCDDTAAAVVAGGRLRSSVVSSQDVHETFGGVVPELASRDHQRLIVPVVQQALAEAEVAPGDLDAVAATYGPGLAGALLVGLSFAKAYAFGLDVPLVGVNHLEGHIYSVFIEPPAPAFPYLCLVVSGGHTQLVLVEDGFQHHLLGTTRDDAAGEAFDKVGTLLGLGYPGGPAIDRLAQEGDPSFHDFPRTRLGYDFSFSGLKTSVLYYLNEMPDDERAAFLQEHLADVCASFQQAIVDVLIDALRNALHETGVAHVAIVGGVSANTALRAAATDLADEEGVTLHIPHPRYSVDNAAMIAVTAHHKLAAGHTSPLTLTAAPSLAL